MINLIQKIAKKKVQCIYVEKFSFTSRKKYLLEQSFLWENSLRYQLLELGIAWCDFKIEFIGCLCRI